MLSSLFQRELFPFSKGNDISMDPKDKKISELTQRLEKASAKISELEREHHPLQQKGQLEYRIQKTLMEDISSLLSLINSTEDLIWFVDCNKRLLLANDITRKIFKESHAVEIEPGMRCHDFLPEDQAEYFDQIFESALRGKTLRLNHSGIGHAEYAATIQPVRSEDQIIGASIFTRNITQVHMLQEELSSFEQIVASTPDPIALIDKQYRFQFVNDAFAQAFNSKKELIIGKQVIDLVGEKHFATYTTPHLEIAFSGELTQFKNWVDLPGPGRRFLSVTYHPLHSQDLKPKNIVVNIHDITELKLAEDDRQKIFEVSLDMLAVIDFDGRFVDLNPAWAKTLGWPEEQLKNQSWLSLVVEDDKESSNAVNKRLNKGESVVGFENRCLCQDGSFRWLAWSSFPDPDQKLIYAAVRDITNRRRLEDELRQLATTDPLTGASNRRHFIERAEAELRRSKRYGSQIAVIMLDVDHFKSINDRHGHAIGDVVLKRLVDCCHQELRASDIFGRFGGEEFAAVLVESEQKSALQTCERLSQQIARLKIRTPEGSVSITVSIGLTMRSASDIAIDHLLKRADDALYKAKKSGRNKIVVL